MEKFLCVLGVFDEETQQTLKEYQQALLSQGFTGRQTMGIPFHVTLGTFKPDRRGELEERFQDLEAAPVAVHFSHIGMFQGQEVLFLAPDVTRELLDLKEYFGQEESWCAHTTMLIDHREKTRKAFAILGDRFHQFPGRIVKAALYQFFPAEKLAEKSFDKGKLKDENSKMAGL